MSRFQISRIVINKLFGVYDYDLSPKDLSNDKFLIIYGDNGTGKSTILRLLYYMLSSRSRSGHKTEIANIPFLRVTIFFIDGTYISATRSNELIGEYMLEYHGDKLIQVPMRCEYSFEQDRYRVPYNENDNTIDEILSRFSELNILFISDKRKELNTINQENPIRKPHGHHDDKEEAIDRELKLLHEWVVNQALSSTKKGEEGASTVYEKVLAQLQKEAVKHEAKSSLQKVKASFEDISLKVQKYVAMGFISDPDYGRVLSRIDGIPKDNESIAYSILAPYIEMQKQKIEALDSLVELISHFTRSLNQYFYRKAVLFSIQDGFSIRHEGTDMIINPRDLSSGEKQLILLLSKVIRNNGICSMIIVDEPEISLNIKWQRMLLDSLNYFSTDGAIQFIIATHSIEILTGHLDNLVKLNSNNND